MRITRKFFIHDGSLHRWLWRFSVLFLAGLLVGATEAAYAASGRSRKSSHDERRLERVSSPAVAADGRRVALVIGNANYQVRSNILDNPLNDAEDIARDLRRFGFTVVVGKDLSRRDMKRAIADFGRSATNADVALFFYAGHGVQSKAQNYLIPVDAEVLSEADLADEGISLSFPLEELDNAKSRVNIVILDACRNNDFSGKFRNSALPGLASPGSMPKGTVIVYATDPGNVAADGDGRNGLFTAGLRKALEQGTDLSLDGVLTVASEHVETVSDGKQTPYVNGPKTLQKKFYFAESAAGGDQTDPAEAARLADIEQQNKQAREELQNTQAEIARAKQRQQEAEEQARLAEAAARRKRAADAVVVPMESPQPPPEREAALCDYCPEMVDIPAGSFEMGSQSNETGRKSNEGPVHTVHISAFHMGKYEVTRGQFRAFVDNTGYKTEAEQRDGCYIWNWIGSSWEQKPEYNWINPGFAQEDNHPVACVSRNDAMAYAEWLAKETGKPYRLPTEAEWEYAARAGTTTARFWGNNPNKACKYANVTDYTKSPNGGTWAVKHECNDGYWFTAPVGSYAANPWGLHDMLGNVWEWNQDKWHSNYDGAPTDGSAWESGDSPYWLLRGGSWLHGSVECRTAYRNSGAAPGNNGFGFRVVASP